MRTVVPGSVLKELFEYRKARRCSKSLTDRGAVSESVMNERR